MKGSVRKRGDRWYFSFEVGKIDGKRKRVERVGGRTKKEAEASMREAMREYENTGMHFDVSEISVADYMDFWLDSYVRLNCRPNTINGYKNIIDKHIKPVLGTYKLKHVSPMSLQQFVNDKFIFGFSKSHLVGMVSVLHSAFKAAVFPYKMIKDNPMEYVKLPRMDKTKAEVDQYVLSREEIKKILERFPLGSSFYMPVMLAYHTGMRVGEVLGLTWDRVDLQAMTLTVDRIQVQRGGAKEPEWCFGPTKTQASVRTIAIGATLVAALKEHKKKQIENRLRYGEVYVRYALFDDRIKQHESATLDFVCTKESGELITHNTMKYLSRVVNYGLGVTFNFHALRHTHATMLIENGANLKDVQKRLGHSRLATTMDTYTHATEKMAKGTVDVLERALSTSE